MIDIKAFKLKEWRPLAQDLEKRIKDTGCFGNPKAVRYGANLVGLEYGVLPATFNLTTQEFLVWSRASQYSGYEVTPEELLEVKQACVNWFGENKEVLNSVEL